MVHPDAQVVIQLMVQAGTAQLGVSLRAWRSMAVARLVGRWRMAMNLQHKRVNPAEISDELERLETINKLLKQQVMNRMSDDLT